MKIHEEMRVVMTRLFCDKCEAEMEHTGEMLMSYPAKYPYVCPSCKDKINCLSRYPCIDYRKISDEEKSALEDLRKEVVFLKERIRSLESKTEVL